MSSSAVGQKGSKGKKAMSLFMSLLTFAHLSLLAQVIKVQELPLAKALRCHRVG